VDNCLKLEKMKFIDEQSKSRAIYRLNNLIDCLSRIKIKCTNCHGEKEYSICHLLNILIKLNVVIVFNQQ